MRAGTLNRKCQIKKSTSTVDAYGGQVPTWTTFCEDKWTQVRQLTMRELFAADQVQAPIDTEFIMRYTAGILPGMMLVYASKEYNIHSVIDVGDEQRELRILASRRST